MSVFDLDLKGQASLADEARANPLDLSQVQPSFFTGTPSAIGQGLMRGGARTAQFIGMAAAAPLVLAEKAFGEPGEFTDPYFRELDEYATDAVDYWTPAAAEVGKGGHILGGLSEIALPLMLGGGNPTALIGAQQIGLATDLTREGVDPATALTAGELQGVATAVGFRLPFLGKTLWSRMATGAGGNLALNTLTTAAQQQVIERRGFGALAANYDAFDVTSRAVDILTGIAFGGIAHLKAPRLTPEQRAAIAGANNAKHFQSDTAPGRPADPRAATAHQQALEGAIDAILRGDPVAVPAAVVQADFIPRPETPAHAERAQAVAETVGEPPIPRVEVPRAAVLSAGERVIESRFAESIASDLDSAIEAYQTLPESDGGKILNTDIARELSPDYIANRGLSRAVHEPASFLVKQMYARKLQEAPKAGELPVVVFSAGGTGAGKTRGLELAAQGSDAVREAQIVYDSNLNTLSSAASRVDQALAAGKEVTILYTYRDPVEALTDGALPRAMRQAGELGSGRTVPITEHAKTHLGSAKVVKQLVEKYKDDPRVDIIAIDNSRGRNQAVEVDLADVPTVKDDYNQLVGKLHEALEEQLAKGRISQAVYEGFRGTDETAAAVQPEAGERSGQGAAQPAVSGQTVYTSTGRSIQVAPKIVEAADLVTSDTEGYPQGLQPRQRGERIASDAQIADIAQNLKPELLGPSATADTGAPIVGADNAVESGNGRVLALRRAYAEGGAAGYRAYLESQGYDLTGFKEPVLVRERTTPMELAERQAFAVEANKPTTMALSTLERAQADAVLLDEAVLDKLKGSDLAATFNADFLRAFLAKLAPGERNAMMDATGNISQEGIRRAQAAILAKAYGRTPEAMAVLTRMLESNDAEARSVLGALTDAAPAIAKLADAVERGDVLPQFDVSGKITKAAEELAAIRSRGQAIGEALKQQDLLAPRDPIVDALLKAFYNRQGTRLAPREQIAATLTKYAKQAAAVPKNQGDMFGAAERTPEALLGQAAETPAEQAALPQEDLFAVAAARQVANDPTLTVPTGEVAADGSPVLVSAAELMMRTDRELTEAQNDAKGFGAAVDCYLQRGAA